MINRSLIGNTRRKCIDFIRIDLSGFIRIDLIYSFARKYKRYLIWDEIIG